MNHDPSQPLPNPRHEAFARAVGFGASAAAAYRANYPDASAATAETEGPALARSPQTALRVAWYREAAEQVARQEADDAVLCLAEKRRICAEIARRGDKNADRINAIKVDNDMAPDVEAKPQTVRIVIGQ